MLRPFIEYIGIELTIYTSVVAEKEGSSTLKRVPAMLSQPGPSQFKAGRSPDLNDFQDNI